MNVNFARKFKKQRDRAPQEIKRAFSLRLNLFNSNPFHPLLDNHALTGKYKGLRSINVTGDWRALYSEHSIKEGELIIFHLLDTHSNLYS